MTNHENHEVDHYEPLTTRLTIINIINMDVSENSVPLNPMVLLIMIPIKWLFVWEYTLFSDKPTS